MDMSKISQNTDVEVGGKMNVSGQKCSHHMLPEAHVLRHNLLGELHLLSLLPMLDLYDSSPYSIESQAIRLKAACALSTARIKSLVWGEDALAFTHFVPTNLTALYLVVADQNVHLASTKVTNSLPYEVFAGMHERYVEYIGMYPDQPRIFPYSVYLQPTTPLDECNVDDPEMIFVHPQSQFHLDVHDDSRSISLPLFPDNIRFPTRTAFLDSMIATILDPPPAGYLANLAGR